MPPSPTVINDARAEQAWNEAALAAPVVRPAWRLWRYTAPAVVLGRAQRGRVAAATAAGRTGVQGLPLVDRQAGGGAVLVGPWLLSLSVVLPPDHPLVAGRSIAASYAEIGAAMAAVLAAFGVPALPAIGPAVRKAAPTLSWACFAGVTMHEVVVEGRKIVGFAQRRQRHGTLLVGGVLVDPVPWSLLVDSVGPLLPVGGDGDVLALASGLARETVSMAEVLGVSPSIDALARGIAVELEELLGDTAGPAD